MARQGKALCQAGLPSFSNHSMVQTAKCHSGFDDNDNDDVKDKEMIRGERVVTQQKRSSVNCWISK